MIDTPSAVLLASGDEGKPVGVLVVLILMGCAGVLWATGLAFNVRGLQDTYVRRQLVNKRMQAQQSGNLGLMIEASDQDTRRFAKVLGWLMMAGSAVLLISCTVLLIV
ncbi:hypothetical protein ACPA54_08770 [Uniformispora flossi]|uniref:hypothetical protein n=1 Tax=Uniformispora flossi TaxID=3390723 RepID=UPI003C2DF4B4